MHEAMKATMGIACASCQTCCHLGSDGDWESGHTFSTCEHMPGRDNLRSFPFKKEQPCWEPNFWETKFADMVKGDDASNDAASDAFHAAGKAIDPTWERADGEAIPSPPVPGGEVGK